MNKAVRGFSLVEIAVALAIMAFLLLQAVPMFSGYMRDTKVRAAAETFLAGVQRARSEAVRRNATVEILLTTSAPTAANVASATASTTGTNWMIRTTDQTDFIEGKPAADSAAGTVIDAAVASVTFNGLGRTTLTADTSFNFTSSQATCQADGGPVRCLRVMVSLFGQARLCDPKAASSDTRSCS
jgi:type IV fimbrial biogenesis protein FimT